jgi:tetratricopeptide (TPR) repeat protein
VLLRDGKPTEASLKYTEAIEALHLASDYPDTRQLQVLLSNRSAAHLQAGAMEPALVDAFEAVKLDPSWPKAHFRKVTALRASKRTRKALEACEVGLKFDPDNATLQSLRAELVVQLLKESGECVFFMLSATGGLTVSAEPDFGTTCSKWQTR